MKIEDSYIGKLFDHFVILFRTDNHRWFVQSEYAAPGSVASYNTRLEELPEEKAHQAIKDAEEGGTP